MDERRFDVDINVFCFSCAFVQVRPILQKVGRGPDWKITLIQDGLALTFVALAVAAILTQSFLAAALGGMSSQLVSVIHNRLGGIK